MIDCYLASPYTLAPDRDDAARQAAAAAGFLMARLQWTAFATIVHGHAIALASPEIDAGDEEFWRRQCMPYLAMSQRLVVLQLDGWERSKGVAREIAAMRMWARPVLYMRPGEMPG